MTYTWSEPDSLRGAAISAPPRPAAAIAPATGHASPFAASPPDQLLRLSPGHHIGLLGVSRRIQHAVEASRPDQSRTAMVDMLDRQQEHVAALRPPRGNGYFIGHQIV